MYNYLCWFTAFVWSVVGVSVAFATPLDHFGISGAQQSTAGGTVASSSGAIDVLTNPALLTDFGPHVTFGMTTVFDRSSILLMPRPNGYDPVGYDERLIERADTLGERRSYAFVGGQFVLLPRRVYASVVGIFPAAGVSNIGSHFSDETEQYFSNQLNFARFGRRLSSEIFGAGVSYRFSDRLSFGVSTLILPQVASQNDVYTPNAVEPSTAMINLDTQSSTAMGVVVGLKYLPVDGLSLGVSFRDELTGRIQGRNLIQINGAQADTPFEQAFTIVSDTLPATISIGGKWTWETGSFIELGGRYVAWSNAVDGHGDPMGMTDIIEGNLGGGLSFDDGDNELRLGAGWRPSPTPEQSGRTNYVDNDRLVFAGGSAHRFRLGERLIKVGLSVQVHLLLPEETHKSLSGGFGVCGTQADGVCDEVPNQAGLQTGNPGFPGYTHGGHFLVVGLDAQWYFDE